jgi:hypothetical protein
LKPDQEEAFNRSAFWPFLIGPFSKSFVAFCASSNWLLGCIGKTVALHELRLVVASFVLTFDAEFTPDFDKAAFLDLIYDRFSVSLHLDSILD